MVIWRTVAVPSGGIRRGVWNARHITNELRLRRAPRGSGVHRRTTCGPLGPVQGRIEGRRVVGARRRAGVAVLER